VKLRKKTRTLAASNQTLEERNKALQELCGKQRLELDDVREEASQSGHNLIQSKQTIKTSHYSHTCMTRNLNGEVAKGNLTCVETAAS